MKPTTLFISKWIVCPHCYPPSKGFSSEGRIALNVLPDGSFEGKSCHHKFTLYESLVCTVGKGIFGILSVFGHWDWSIQEKVRSGKVVYCDVPSPDDYKIFAVFLTPIQDASQPNLHVMPSVMEVRTKQLLLSFPVGERVDSSALGTPIEVCVFVYAYWAKASEGWKTLLYDSLADFTNHKHDLSIFKLATSVELYADAIFEKYLKSKGIAEPLFKRIAGGARDWGARIGRVKDLAKNVLATEEYERFELALGPFRQDVRDPRNQFAHGAGLTVSHKDNCKAFESAFRILWVLNVLDRMLP